MDLALFVFCAYLFIAKLMAYSITDVILLKKDLFQNYDRQIIPVTDMNTSVKVSMYFSLLSVYELDMKNQLLSTSAAFKISWRDELMIWNSTNYSGLDRLTVTLASIWKPDVIILNSVSTQKTLTNDDDNHYVTVNHDGSTEWWAYVNLQTHCKVDMTNYPFETQICDINVTKSYLNDQSEILRSEGDSLSLANYVPNGEWEVLSFSSYRQVFFRSNTEISGLQLKIKMKRKRTFYTWNFLMPSISLSIADCFSFLLPAKSSEKLGLSIFVFLANAVLIRLFNDSVPPNSDDVSNFGRLLWINILISGLVIMVNVIITSLFYCKSPKCISKCCFNCTDMFKCREITKRCKCCEHDHPKEKKEKKSNNKIESPTTKVKEEYTLITNGNISIEVKEGFDQLYIHQSGMKIQLEQ
ncbi:CHRNN [Mytilus coruscus]|uniref:CHRNN n=1 Tax=Mytilus coruscus TaxID=42192 RepID=A0A6J8EVL0_MYTCO|nr:CHRNN [Mytilus coruscus]